MTALSGDLVLSSPGPTANRHRDRGRVAPRRRGRRGATLLLFLLVAMPLLSFSAMLAVDFMRIVVINRETSNFTGAAALAGAQQYVQNKPRIDAGKARKVVGDMLDRAQNAGAFQGVRVTPVVTPSTKQVTVVTSYQIERLVFIPVVTTLFGLRDAGPPTYTVTRTATLCIPDEVRTGEAARLQSCRRPR